jgi:hypothetical protein
MKTGVFTEF